MNGRNTDQLPIPLDVTLDLSELLLQTLAALLGDGELCVSRERRGEGGVRQRKERSRNTDAMLMAAMT